ncbi:basic leucine zipper transcription factor [Lithospermum erythrorhizon]|uniref:Basic leucine zipper transcription factor n=1 Tax=Lithospermum erythrorhizon TaxID=34254 RepID=A0AAV3RHJ2_LITER
MGSNINFKNFGNDPGGEERPLGNYPLARQQSIYTLTFDELQNTMGGSLGKDFGSMNMDELLKSIWSAEETQTMGPGPSGGVQGGGDSGGYLQRQGSLTLPRTLSQKTVDEVWKDMSREFGIGKDGSGVGGPSIPQRQQTLGEITLEEFLVRAGVVREDTQSDQKANNSSALFGDLSQPGNNYGLSFDFQQAVANTGLVGGKLADSSNLMTMQSPNLPLNVNGVRSTQQQLGAASNQQQQGQHQHQQKQQPIFPKQPTLAFGAHMAIPNGGGLGSPRLGAGTVGASNQSMNTNTLQNGALQGGGMSMAGLGAGGVSVAVRSPSVSSDGLGKSNGDMSSVSPVPYMFNGGFRGRKSSTLERTVERRQRRMIKNRESAARSRARKQAYTMELEAEVAKLKEENQELRKKRAEMMEMQKNQVLEMVSNEPAAKRRSLRRTQTGPW